ncbi:MAG TPA: hypothetical protein VF493_05930 [Terriglobales bacterium]
MTAMAGFRSFSVDGGNLPANDECVDAVPGMRRIDGLSGTLFYPR